jgi:IstB-like ATP binding protein
MQINILVPSQIIQEATMKRNFAIGVLGGLVGFVLVLIILSTAGIVGARGADVARSDVARANAVSAATPLTSTFTYQGQLKNGGSAVTGSCQMAFRLYDDPLSGDLIGSPITSTVPVTNGLFTVGLNFGGKAFNGNGRWLDILVACGGIGFTPLTPRQAITPAPYALFAGNANPVLPGPGAAATVGSAGNPGLGKTHIATGLALAACRQGRRVRFYNAAGLVNELLQAQDQHHLPRFLASLLKQHLIVIDELGFIPFTTSGAQLLFQVCSSLYERVALILTTNLRFADWTQVFGDERLTGALLDRLTHRAHILEFRGESYRFRQHQQPSLAVAPELPLEDQGGGKVDRH